MENFRELPLEEMERRVARFEEAVLAAQLTAPPSREALKRAVHRKGVERPQIWLRRTSPDLAIKYGQDLIDLFTEYPDDLGRVAPYDIMMGYAPKTDMSVVEGMMKDSVFLSEWGVGWKHIVGGVGASECSHPLKDWADLDEYIETGFPNPDDHGRVQAAIEPVKKLHAADRYVFGLFGSVLYHVFSIRGIENGLMDLYTETENMQKLIDALTEYAVKLVRMWATTGVDALLFLDDWGTQNGLLISPGKWRELFKEGYRAIFEETHRMGMDAMLHTCGNVVELIDDLIDSGVDVLDPIQTSTMKIEELAEKFGGRICFQGAIDVQHLLPLGTPQEVRDTIRRTKDVLGKPFGNSLILAPTNVITPDVPLENLQAMFEACHEA